MTSARQPIFRAFRVDTSFDAEIVVDGEHHGIVARNLSPTGAQLDGVDALSQGLQLTLSIAALGDHEAVVIWATPTAAGVKFVKPIEIEAFHRWQLTTDPASLLSPSKLDWLKQLINS